MMPRGRINGWKCPECGGVTYAVHVDDGVTPMFLACRASGTVFDCAGTAESLMYPDRSPPPHVVAAVSWEWYRPDGRELRRASRNVREHVRKGGLQLRPITAAGHAALAEREESE